MSFFVKNGLVGLIIGASIGGTALAVLVFCVLRGWREKRKRTVRFVDFKESGDDVVELGKLGAKGGVVRVVEKKEGRTELAGCDGGEEMMYFDPPPRRATVVLEKKGRKRAMMGS